MSNRKHINSFSKFLNEGSTLRGYWSKEKCHKEAKKYNTRSEFRKENLSAYTKALREGWLDEVCSHMKVRKTKWSLDKCREEALKYEHRGIFQKRSNGAYSKALREGWLDEICSHMIPIGNMTERYIYAYEFPETNSVYIGLSYNLDKRHKKHMSDIRSTVYKYLVNHNLSDSDFIYKELGYYDMLIASQKEGEFEKNYKDNGWIILNKAKTGSLGGNYRKWTKEKCQKEALKFNTKREFRKGSPLAYNATHKNNWMDEICSHMTLLVRKPWTKEECKEEALKYNTKIEFRKGNNKAYNASYKNDWLDDICSHMTQNNNPQGYWTYERCKEEALKYNRRSDYQKNSNSSYNKSRKNKWLDEICSHMKGYKPKGYWNNKEKCQKEASKYNSIYKFQKGSNRAYVISKNNGWLYEFFPSK